MVLCKDYPKHYPIKIDNTGLRILSLMNYSYIIDRVVTIDRFYECMSTHLYNDH